jgi:predicted CXXCH cytochrome family protein
MNSQRIRLPAVLLLVLVPLVLAGGCEQDPGPTGPLGTAAGLAYLGYGDAIHHLPVCVTCHSDNTYGWRNTAHAYAMNTLNESGFASSSCRPCHTTGWNATDGLFGADDAWAAAGADTTRLADVQCEDCHGPASQHNSMAGTVTDIRGPDDAGLWAAELCGTCHEGTHHPYFSEWAESLHADSLIPALGQVATDPACTHCHVAQSFEAFVSDGTDDFVPAEPEPITCQACHTAHSNTNPGQLRLPLGDDILCAKCHNAEGIQPGRALHHATWEVFKGELDFGDGLNGYSGETYENSTHTTLLAEEACVACHVFPTPYVSELEPAGTGHTFKPQLAACQGCHPSAVSFDLGGVQTATQALINALQAELAAAGRNDKATPSYKRALFVRQAAETEGSLGVHNTKYIQKLLQDAIDDFTPTGG